MSKIKIEGYYQTNYNGMFQVVYVTKVTDTSVTYKVIHSTFYASWPFGVGTTHEITYGTFSSLYSPYPKIKGMLLDGSDNE